MLSQKAIDTTVYQLGNYLEHMPDGAVELIVNRHNVDTTVQEDLSQLTLFCELLMAAIKKEHNLVNLLGIRVRLLEFKQQLNAGLSREANEYVAQILQLVVENVDDLGGESKETILDLVTRYRLTMSMSGN